MTFHHPPDGDSATPLRDRPAPDIMSAPSRYRPQASSRLAGFAGTTTVFAVAITSLFLTIDHVVRAPAPPPLTLFDLQTEKPPAPVADPETPPEPRDAKEPPPQAIEIPPIEPPARVAASEVRAAPLPPVERPPEPGAVALKLTPPPAPRSIGNGSDSWEARVLASLNKHRRYPRLAMMRRQQGVPYIRFVMDRGGRVLSSRLERSSGFADLDREAVALAERATPLPKPPDDHPGDTIELVVPVEFFMR